MPEIKHNFTGGRMNKDLDERLVPNGEYRDAMNIQVSTSEGSDVGTVQNILGNAVITESFAMPDEAMVISSIADEKIDTLYYLVWTPDIDYILSYKRNDTTINIVFRDVNKNVLRFDPRNIITGINIVDDMLFWTDNQTEPKKINIPRCVAGTPPNTPNVQTKLVNSSQGISNLDIEEKHITVIKKSPPTPLEVKLVGTRLSDKIYTGVITTGIDDGGSNNTSFFEPTMYNFSGITTQAGSNVFDIVITTGINSLGNEVGLGPVGGANGLTGWHKTTGAFGQNKIAVGTKIVFKPYDNDGSPPGLPVTAHVLKGIVEDSYPASDDYSTWYDGVRVRITSIDGIPPLPDPSIVDVNGNPQTELKYVVDLFDESEKLFEFKFPRFSYRYKYEDGEYSPFAPFTQVAFSAGSFDYHPRKGYNLGMINRLRRVRLGKFINRRTPKDIVSVDILFKDEPSPNIYIVDTIRPNDHVPTGATQNAWHKVKGGGYFDIEKETINSVVPSNQLLRPWDNVPKRALAQDVTGNRIVYGNYIQNYNLKTSNNKNYFAEFDLKWNNDGFKEGLTQAGKSIKSLREYQLGVVFVDEYGRETPVISNPTGTMKLEKDAADKNNRIEVAMLGNEFPRGLTHFKFFVKETSSEYYNMAMGRWYDAEDGNIWLAFPSSDRNKIDIDTFLILKKGTDADELVVDEARYKVIAIENEAPDFIKTNKKLISKHVHDSATEIFDMSGLNVPLAGWGIATNREIKLNYTVYHGTAGQDLANIKDDLYIEFEKVNSNEISGRYKISSITNDWDKGSTGAGETLANAQYTIRLENELGDDVNFISNDPFGTSSTFIEHGAIINIYQYKVENRPQFDGRFFVKIYNDDVFKNNIVTQVEGAETFTNLGSRKIYGISTDHVNRHTVDVGRYLVEGNTTSSSSNDWDNGAGNADNLITGIEHAWGYYLDDRFSAYAQYFRRYMKGSLRTASVWEGFDANLGGIGAFNLDMTDFQYKQLIHLKPGGGYVDYLPHNGIGESTKWQPADNWQKEFGKPSATPDPQNWSDGGQTAFFQLYTREAFSGLYKASFYYEGGGLDSDGKSTFGNGVADNPKDTDVWFIDRGPWKGIASTNHLDWPSTAQPHGPLVPGITNAGNISSTSDSGDNHQWLGASDFQLMLGFGGIMVAPHQITKPNFFNVGDWHITPPDAPNSNYNNETSFVENFNLGSMFRWKEDPDQTIYIIGGNPTELNLTRHSLRRYALGTKLAKYLSGVSSNTTLGLDGYGVNHNKQPNTMAESLSFNFTKNWTLTNCKPLDDTPMAGKWNPDVIGAIPNGLEVKIAAVGENGGTSGEPTSTCIGLGDDLKIFVGSLEDTNFLTNKKLLQKGMALSRYSTTAAGDDLLQTHLGANSNEFLVIRHIVDQGDYYELWLGGYSKPMTEHSLGGAMGGEHEIVSESTKRPAIGTEYTFVQVGINGYSPNSEFNINTMGHAAPNPVGKVGAVGYTLEFIGPVEEPEILSSNPAIFETEPKDAKDLDIYYEATGAIPINVNASNIQDAVPIGSTIKTSPTYDVHGYVEDEIIISPIWSSAMGTYTVVRPDGLELEINVLAAGSLSMDKSLLEIEPFLYNSNFSLPWHNCFSFGNGVESNRIRDNFNLAYITNGVKASTTLEQEYKQEHRKYGLIYSGLYNSTSGVNNLNQFIAAEKITKDVNPIYGSIQKLHSRDTDLVTLCEDKCLRILANKDAVFNADGNTNLTATENVLGQTIPFSGEYGISTNPESFASESYRVYFADRVRGAIMRLSKDGLTPISDHGMKDWFKDNLKLSNRIIGSYDDKKEEYNITLKKIYGTSVDGVTIKSEPHIYPSTSDGTSGPPIPVEDTVG